MSYAKAADAAETYAEALRSACADSQVMRISDAFAGFARALENKKNKEAVLQAVETVADKGATGRLGGVSLGDVAAAAAQTAALARSMDAKPSVVNALQALSEIADAHAPMDAAGVVAALKAVREAELAEEADKLEKQREKQKADRRLGALYAEKLSAAPQTRDGMSPLLSEMKKRKPALSHDAWKEAANLWVRLDENRTAKDAKAAIQAKFDAVASSSRSDEREMTA